MSSKLEQLQAQVLFITILAKDDFGLELTDYADSDVIIDAFTTAPDKGLSSFRFSSQIKWPIS
ncbi:hypothetical protein [Bombilactobacillus bombi]|uniref:hypothetical protein n=1 Tax=Bombilactobacillus bombi TaxID=1303590 RepID=UPI002159CFED|nr:hypothetical protein [Bombilactobacillus bombi]